MQTQSKLQKLVLSIIVAFFIGVFVVAFSSCKTVKKPYYYKWVSTASFRKDSCTYYFFPCDRRSQNQMDWGEKYVSRRDTLNKWHVLVNGKYVNDTLVTDLEREVR